MFFNKIVEILVFKKDKEKYLSVLRSVCLCVYVLCINFTYIAAEFLKIRKKGKSEETVNINMKLANLIKYLSRKIIF